MRLNTLPVIVGHGGPSTDLQGLGQLISTFSHEAVRADEAAAYEFGITGVPALLIDERVLVLGAQGANEITAPRQAWASRVP